MPAKTINLHSRKRGRFAAMGRQAEPVAARTLGGSPAIPMAPLRNDAGGVPTRAIASIRFCSAARPTNGGEFWLRDYSRAKSNSALPKAVGFGTSSSCPVAPIRTPNIWRSSVQAGGEVSFPCEHGATRKTALIATSTGCLSSFARTSVIAGSFRFTSRAIPTCRAIARSRRTPPARPLCSIVWNRTAHRHALTTDARSWELAA